MVTVRPDLVEAHRSAWAEIARPGSWWTGSERLAIARIVREAFGDDEPTPPWVPFSTTGRAPTDGLLPDVAVDVTYRIARHAGTITDSVAGAVISRLGEPPVGGLRYVELCSIVSATAAVVSFHRNVGLQIPEFPAAVDGEPTRERPEEIAAAELNWVPVAAPADVQAAVLQAYSAVPGAQTMTWRLASAQYIPPAEMVHAGWMRRSDGLTRAETELVAARVAQLRECFY